MSAGWVAAATRGRALLGSLVGAAGARAIAAAPSWDDARAELARTSYGSTVPAGAGRAEARWGVAMTTAWDTRVLAGWLPPAGRDLARVAAGPLEIANVERHLAELDGASRMSPIPLGSLDMAWDRVRSTTTAPQVRSVLAMSVWGDPGGADPVAIGFGLRVAWARRLLRWAPSAAPWALGMVAVLIAREVFVFDREINSVTGHELDRLVGNRWRSATDVARLTDELPDASAWVLAGIQAPGELWRAESALLRRVAADAGRMATSSRYRPDTVTAVFALLLVDLWRVGAAIEAAGRDAAGLEVLDATAT